MLLLVALGALMGLTVPVQAPEPAAAHARVAGTDPLDGAVLDTAPARVTIFLAAKPVTVEGDPLRVYGPGGERLDDGRVAVMGEDRAALSVGLLSDVVRPSGQYHVAYRLISSDSHLIAGRFSFTTRRPAGVSSAGLPAGPAAVPVSDRAARARQQPSPWPRIAFAGGIAVAALGLVGGSRRRGRRPLLPPAPVPRPRPAGTHVDGQRVPPAPPGPRGAAAGAAGRPAVNGWARADHQAADRGRPGPDGMGVRRPYG